MGESPWRRRSSSHVLFGLFGGDVVYSSPAVGPSISLSSSLLLFVLRRPQIFMQWQMFPHSPRNDTIGCQYSVHLPSSAPSCVFHGHLQGQNINFSVKSIDSMTTTTPLVWLVPWLQSVPFFEVLTTSLLCCRSLSIVYSQGDHVTLDPSSSQDPTDVWSSIVKDSSPLIVPPHRVLSPAIQLQNE